jgi:hypothetical protein
VPVVQTRLSSTDYGPVLGQMNSEGSSLTPVYFLLSGLGVLMIAMASLVNHRLSSMNRKLHRVESHTRRMAQALAPEQKEHAE